MENNMRMSVEYIESQFYIIPTFSITHNRWLNGAYEFSFVWLKWVILLKW